MHVSIKSIAPISTRKACTNFISIHSIKLKIVIVLNLKEKIVVVVVVVQVLVLLVLDELLLDPSRLVRRLVIEIAKQANRRRRLLENKNQSRSRTEIG